MLIYIGTFDLHGIRAKWEIVRKLCGLTAIGPTLDWARRCTADELPTSFDLVELDKDQTLSGRVWFKFRLLVGRIPTLVRRCGISRGVESIIVVTQGLLYIREMGTLAWLSSRYESIRSEFAGLPHTVAYKVLGEFGFDTHLGPVSPSKLVIRLCFLLYKWYKASWLVSSRRRWMKIFKIFFGFLGFLSSFSPCPW